MLPQVERCCCGCCKLRTGTLVIGYFQLIASLVVVLAYLYFFDYTQLTESQGVEISSLIYFAIHVVITVLLVIGAHKDRSGFIYAWLIFNAICVVIDLILYILAAVFASNLNTLISTVVTGFIDLALSVYFIIVVYSHYNNVKGNTAHPLSQA